MDPIRGRHVEDLSSCLSLKSNTKKLSVLKCSCVGGGITKCSNMPFFCRFGQIKQWRRETVQTRERMTESDRAVERE